MIPTVGLLKARRFVDEHGRALVVGLAVLALLSLGGAAWIYATPPTTTVTDHTQVQHVQTELHTNASVTGSNELYPVGTALHDEPTYLFAASPNVTVGLRTVASDGTLSNATQSLALVVRAKRDGDVFWRDTIRHSRTRSNRSLDGPATTALTLDVDRVRERVQDIRSEIGQSGSVDVQFRSSVSYETGHYAGEQNKMTPLRISGNAYAIEPFSTERRHSTPVTRTTTVPRRNTVPHLVLAGTGIGALIAAGVVGAYYRRGPAPDTEQRLHELRYAEWISEGSLDPELGSTRIPVHGLEELVDVAIDTKKRVIHDPAKNHYAVLDGDVVYCYQPGGSSEASRAKEFEWNRAD